MSEKQFVAVITGPAGSGKSTIGFLLKKQTERCTNIDVDDVKHFIGFEYDLDSNGKKVWRFEEWKLLGESIGLLGQKFHQASYDVLITGYLNEESLKELERSVKLTHKILLLPKLDTSVTRDSSRDKDIVMGSNAIKEHHEYFSSHPYFNDFIKVDSTSLTKEQTVNKIKEIIGKNWGEL